MVTRERRVTESIYNTHEGTLKGITDGNVFCNWRMSSKAVISAKLLQNVYAVYCTQCAIYSI